MSVIPATWEARQKKHLNPGGGGCSELRSCHCTPVWATRVRLRLTKKKKPKQKTKKNPFKYYVIVSMTYFRTFKWNEKKKKMKFKYRSCFPKLFLKHKHQAGRGGSSLQSQHFGRPRRADHEVRRSRPSWLTRWNPVSTKKYKKLAGRGGRRL